MYFYLFQIGHINTTINSKKLNTNNAINSIRNFLQMEENIETIYYDEVPKLRPFSQEFGGHCKDKMLEVW